MTIAKTSPALKLLQRVRDEAHRFAVTFHRERRHKNTLQSVLQEIEGVGPKRATALLTAFGSVRDIERASLEELAAHVGWTTARSVHAHFHDADSEVVRNADEDVTDAADDATAAAPDRPGKDANT
jgi:excinuclease ABC subunit C